MTTLELTKITIKGGRLGEAGNYPILFFPLITPKKKITIAETEGLYLGYGYQKHGLPYTTQGDYDHTEEPREFDAYILENDYLKATFLPSLGGRLWSLYDKKKGRDLLGVNTVFRPCNIAMRNAWFSGGVEWNCGAPGHHPLSSDKMYGAEYISEDGSPALRLYAFERCRDITYQMDFFLPHDSDTLFSRVRLVNANERVTPIYWWSTIAVDQEEGCRVVVPATEAYVNHGWGASIFKTQLPMRDGFDTTYATNHTDANDDFYKIPDDKRKFEACIYKDGYGLIHSSTRLLKGRKMFVWGMGEGGQNWQKQLTNEEGKPYLEIQAGLRYTQQESMPFAPCSVLEWVEAYTAIEIDPEAVHGDWDDARRNVENWIDEKLPESVLDEMLEKRKVDSLKEVEYSYKGYPWGTLDNELRAAIGQKQMSANLCFGELEEEQMVWYNFLKTGKLDEPDPSKVPASYMVQEEWFTLLKKAVRGADKDNWYAWYNMGLCYYAREDFYLAVEALEKSVALCPSTWGYHALACSLFSLGECEDAAVALTQAVKMNNSDMNLAKESLKLCGHFKQYEAADVIYEALTEECQQDHYVMGYHAAALAYIGRAAECKEILEQDGGLYIMDIREGDETITNGYIRAVQELAKLEGKEIAAEDVKVPQKIDFRLFNKK